MGFTSEQSQQINKSQWIFNFSNENNNLDTILKQNWTVNTTDLEAARNVVLTLLANDDYSNRIPENIVSITGETLYTVTYFDQSENPLYYGILHFYKDGRMQFISIPANPTLGWFIKNTVPKILNA
jgi:hypothetical protein